MYRLAPRRGVLSWILAALTLGFVVHEMVRADDPRPILAAAPRMAAPRPNADVAGQAASTQHIEELIRQLGDARYTTRRAAASELRQIGPEAFDLLHAATDDADPEVAASARYLLRQIAVRWVQNDDSAIVRALLRDFGDRSDEARLSRVQELAKLPNGEGLAGLCRIARFDRSPRVSRTAALAVIRPPEQSVEPASLDREVVERELGGSTRESAMWLRRYLTQLRDPAASVAFWEKLVEDEAARLEQNADDTSPEIVLALLWNLADIHRQLDNKQGMLGAFDRMVGLNTEASQPVAIELIEWLIEHQMWDVLDEFLAKHQPSFAQNKRLLYYAALARARQGKTESAEQLAEKAAQLDSQAGLESFVTAKDLEEHGQFDWAVREYHRAIDNQQVAAHEAILARIYLASLLHDYEQHAKAADVLEPLVKAIQNEGRVGQLYAELLRYYRGRLALPEADAVAARCHYYRACQHRDTDDRQRERDELELAIKFDRTDADVLIAMYRHPESDPKWREIVRQRIRDLCRQFQQEIDENPTDPTAYNQWAWLVSNTEGDFQKAIRYSHRSLELIPPTAGDSAGGSFLDTLGRCYYAAGDYKNALKYQREAIEKVDYMQVMHRQLALFEKTLAEKQGAGGGEQGAAKSE
ncbi:MAG: hypothetical protein WD229_14295 [Pirellulales bacterium]